MRKLLPKLLSMFAIALTASAQNRMTPERAAGIKADLVGQIDSMKKQAQVMTDTVFSLGELGFQEFETSEISHRPAGERGFHDRARGGGNPHRVCRDVGAGKAGDRVGIRYR